MRINPYCSWGGGGASIFGDCAATAWNFDIVVSLAFFPASVLGTHHFDTISSKLRIYLSGVT